MRLIDLDQKVIVPINDERYGTTYEVQMTVAEIFDKFLEGNKPEVIDAIPVDWLKQQIRMAPKSLWASFCRPILQAWQKYKMEQEAQQ